MVPFRCSCVHASTGNASLFYTARMGLQICLDCQGSKLSEPAALLAVHICHCVLRSKGFMTYEHKLISQQL